MSSERIVATQLVESACQELGIQLAELLALASVWVHPGVVAIKNGPCHPSKRRANLGLRVDGKPVEAVGQVIEGIYLDSNNYPNASFKQALGIDRREFVGFHICHIWPGTAYDPDCFTHLANLVGIPAELASLTDYHPHIVACMKYRAWELYGWKPAKELAPVKPEGYPVRWREPIAPPSPKSKSIDLNRVVLRRAVAQNRNRTLNAENEIALQAAFYLSKFDHKNLQLGNQGQTIDTIAQRLNIKRNTLKNYRDFFDSHTGSHREGWKVDLPPQMAAVFRQLTNIDEPSLRAQILASLK